MWVGDVVLLVGDYHVTIASDDRSALDVLAELYRGREVTQRGDVADFGIAVAAGSTSRPARLPTLYRGRCPIQRCRSVPRLLRRLDHDLSRLEDADAVPGVELASMALVERSGVAALVPASLIESASAVERLLRDRELRLVDVGGFRLDALRGVVTVLPGLADPGAAALADGLEVMSGDRELAAVFFSPAEVLDDDSRAMRFVRFLSRVERRNVSRSQLLECLAAQRAVLEAEVLTGHLPRDVETVARAIDRWRRSDSSIQAPEETT